MKTNRLEIILKILKIKERKMDLNPVSTVFQIPELVRNFLLQSDYDTVINYCQTHVQAQIFCKDLSFWEEKTLHDFGITEEFFRDTNLSPVERYLQLLFLNGGVAIGVEKYEQPNSVDNGYGSTLRRAIKAYRDDIIQYLISKGYKIPDVKASYQDTSGNWIQGYSNWYNQLLYEYARRGDRNLMNQISKLADQNKMYDTAAAGALAGGHLDLFKVLRTLAGNREWNWNYLLQSAVLSGNQQVFDYILSLVPPGTLIDRQYILRSALAIGNIKLFDYILSVVPANDRLEWQHLLDAAAEYNNLEFFDHILSLTQANNIVPNYQESAYYAVNDGLIEMFNHIRSLAPGNNWDWNDLLMGAIKSERQQIVNYVLSLVPPNYVLNWQQLVKEALDTGLKDVFDYILSLAQANNYQPDWQQLAQEALGYLYKDMFDYIRSLVSSLTPDYNWNWNNLLISIGRNVRYVDSRPLYDYVRSLANP